MNIPYTYLLKHVPSNTFYYGVRYAKNCNPDELLVTYFTYSKYVKSLIQIDGIESFEFEIRKTFKNNTTAVKWENTVLRRMKVIYRNDFINKTDNKAIIVNNDWWKGKKRKARTQEHTDKCIKTFKERGRGIGNQHTKGHILNEEHKQKISSSLIGIPKSDSHKKNISNGLKGKQKTAEHLTNISKSLKGKPSPRKGITLSDETKKKISDTKKMKKLNQTQLDSFIEQRIDNPINIAPTKPVIASGSI